MPDQLRERFDALRSAVEHTDTAGLHDIRARRTHRARTRVAVATAASVAALALAGVVVLPQLGLDTTTSSRGDADVLSDSDGSRDSDPTAAEDEVAAGQAPPEEPTEEPTEESATEDVPTEEAPTEEGTPAGPFTLTADSLLTWEDIRAVGETGPGTSPFEASLGFPPLCAALSSPEQYSSPVQYFSAEWDVSDGRLGQSNIQYETDQRAADALTRLVRDSQACPVFNGYATIMHTGTDGSVGSEIAFFNLALESENGSISTAEYTVTRIANVLVEVVLTPYAAVVADADSRSRALAGAAVARIVAIG